MFHVRTKHMSIKYHFIIEAKAINEDDQNIDIFMKTLPRAKFNLLYEMIGVTEINIKKE